jgi:hypothetical protein
MFINFFIWVLAGLFVGYLGHYFDINKMKGIEIYLFIGMLFGYVYAFFINFVLWPVSEGEINFVAVILASIINYFSLRIVDFFFHL